MYLFLLFSNRNNSVLYQLFSTTATNTNTTTTTADGELFVSCLKNMLDKQYEHFGKLNDHLLGMWAGPEHWRKKAKRPKLDGTVKLNEGLFCSFYYFHFIGIYMTIDLYKIKTVT